MHGPTIRNLLAVALAISSYSIGSTAATAANLTPAGTLEFTLSTFADQFPTTGFCCGPLGIAFPTTGGVMVADYTGGVRVFATDVDNQHAPTFPIAQNYGVGNGVGLTSANGLIYMAEQSAGQVVQLNNNGTLNHVVTPGIGGATGLTTNPVTQQLYVSASAGIFQINPVTGTPTLFKAVGADGLTVNSLGTILYAEVGGHIIGYRTSDGVQVFDSGAIAGGPDGTAIGATGPLANKIFVNTNDGHLIEIDLTTLAQTILLENGSRGDFVNVDPLNGTLLITQTDSILRLTPIAGGFDTPGTPLPAALPLFASGLGVLGFIARRKKRKALAA
jgi:hypothetical protein